MFSCSLLPTSLLVVLFAFPALAAPSSPNDPFRGIALQVTKKPELPVCCLRPLEPLETPAEEDVLLSFEDWKAKLMGDNSGTYPSASDSHRPGGGSGTGDHSAPQSVHATVLPSQLQGTSPTQDAVDTSLPDERLSPHFRIPITDRFNYASMDCSARVHTAHRSAKSPSSILSSKKDRYMLSPCGEKKQFVVVELCEDIMIDTVQLANYEFFSGVFKDFTVSVAKTYTTDEAGWTHAGTYRAQNVRGVQSFHPPPMLRDFYRFIRIDFLTHYGNEYYCPLSLLRVYGLTHLEQWKWDEWESQSKAKRALEDASVSVEAIVDPPQNVHVPVVQPIQAPEATSKSHSTTTAEAMQTPEVAASVTPSSAAQSNVSGTPTACVCTENPEEHPSTSPESSQDTVSSSYTVAETATSMAPSDTDAFTTSDDHNLSKPEEASSHDGEAESPTDTLYSIPISVTSSASVSSSIPPSLPVSNEEPSETPQSSIESSRPTQSVRLTASAPASNASTSVVSVYVSQQPLPSPVPQVATGGESIYRTIMNRLTALEGNTTLYARYVEEQTAGVREMLRRLGEDVGRLEGIGNAQAQMYQRSIVELDKQRRRLEIEHRELLSRVHHLNDEVVLEKRLGILQLCLLLAVLVFITLTRGTRGELSHRVPSLGRPLNMRDWGRRTLSLSLSGDWVNRFRSQSPTPKPEVRPIPRPAERSTDKVNFPSREVQTYESPSLGKFSQPSTAGRKLGLRPRTPSSHRVSTPRLHTLHMRPAQHGTTHSTPLSALSRPLIQRSSSGGAALVLGAVEPKSAKRWARSAHLHEVKSAGVVISVERPKVLSGPGHENEAFPLDVFSPQVGIGSANKGKENYMYRDSRPVLSPLRFSTTNDLPRGCVHGGPASEGDASEGDGWVDTDADASESESGMGLDGEMLQPAS